MSTLNLITCPKYQKNECDNFGYFLPHHSVMKDSSTSTKLAVVLDGSQKSDNNLSLNDVQFSGPSLQADIFAILLTFRKHNFIVIADIEKMFRQILIKPRQRHYQKIFWREKPSEELKQFQLNTVTYGV